MFSDQTNLARDFMRDIISRAAAGRGGEAAYALSRYGDNVARLVRGTIAAGGVGSGDWGAVLATPEAQSFFGLVEQASVVGKLNLRQVPLNVRTLALSSGATAYWVGGNSPKPISAMEMSGDTLEPRKVAAMYIITKELAKFADGRSETAMRGDLVRVLAEAIDSAFLSPDNGGDSDKPASVTNGALSFTSYGVPNVDIEALLAGFEGDLSNSFFVSDPLTAIRLSLARNSSGSFDFPNAGPRGGEIMSIPFIVSRSSPYSETDGGGILALIDGSGIAYGGGGVRTAVSQQATIEMSDSPSGPAQMVSLFQANAVAILAEASVSWKVVREGSVVVATEVNYSVES